MTFQEQQDTLFEAVQMLMRLYQLKRMADAYREMGGNDLVKTEMDLVDGLEKRIK